MSTRARSLTIISAPGALVTMAVVPNTEPDKYGGVVVAEDGSVTGFVRRGSHEPSWHFVGVQAAETGRVRIGATRCALRNGGRALPCSLSRRPGAIRAYRTAGEFMDIGTPSDYLDTSLRLAAREGTDTAAHATISPTARVERSVLWDDVVVEDGAMLRECVVTDGVRVPADTHGMASRSASRRTSSRRVNAELRDWRSPRCKRGRSCATVRHDRYRTASDRTVSLRNRSRGAGREGGPADRGRLRPAIPPRPAS